MTLAAPKHYYESKIDKVFCINYQQLQEDAIQYKKKYSINNAISDKEKVCLLLIDVQNTFCIPGYPLFVGGKGGKDAVIDNMRLCSFIYRNLDKITKIICTLDTHTKMQIFHSSFWVNRKKENPDPYTIITLEDIESGKWYPSDEYSIHQGLKYDYLFQYALHYVKKLSREGKYPLTIWPYHAMLGSVGHALVSSVEEVCFFHSIIRETSTSFELKGQNPLTENYSAINPEILRDQNGIKIDQRNIKLRNEILEYDKILIAGQAKSHCVAWTVSDLWDQIKFTRPEFAKKIYLLENMTSPVVIPNIIDYTEQADKSFEEFAKNGMNRVKQAYAIEDFIHN